MRYNKVNEAVQRLLELNQTVMWCNNNLEKAMANMDRFLAEYAQPLDDVYIQLDDEEKACVDEYVK